MTARQNDIIAEITQYLNQYRHNENIIQFEQLSTDDISQLKGCHIRSIKTQEQDYKRGWAKLAKAQKVNRLMEYHKRLSAEYSLSAIQQGQLKTLFYDGVDLLVRDQVIYDISDATIVKIEGLKRDQAGIFYFAHTAHTAHTDPNEHTEHLNTDSLKSDRGDAVTDGKISCQIKKFTPLTFQKLTTAQLFTTSDTNDNVHVHSGHKIKPLIVVKK
jgi:hypothetical protein